MITENFKFENGNLIISKEELIKLRNEYHKKAFLYAKERNFLIRDIFQELIDLTEIKNK